MSARGEARIDGLLDAATACAERDLEDAGDRVPPAFAAVVARAHRIDPQSVPQRFVERAQTADTALPSASGGPGLDPFIDAAKAEAGADQATSGAAGPGLPPTPVRRGRVTGVVASVLGLAAVAAMVLVVSQLRGVTAQRSAAATAGEQAVSRIEEHSDTGRAHDMIPPPRPRPSVKAPPVEPTAEAPEAVPTPPAEPAETTVEPTAASPTDRSEHRSAPKRRVSSRAERLRALDDQAETLLKRGDVAGADRIYARIIGLGGRHRLVQLAYADRFALARRAGNLSKRRALWERYLARFPRGQFADDARAGLCRAKPRQGRARCWAEYLGAFPGGAYRAEANRATTGKDEAQ